MRALFLSLILTVLPAISWAGETDVVDVKIERSSGNKYRINATLKHADTGWDHYANAWDVLDENGKVLGTRVLHHPHVDEQPFTRSLSLIIPASVNAVTIRAHDSVHETGGKTMTVKVPR